MEKYFIEKGNYFQRNKWVILFGICIAAIMFVSLFYGVDTTDESYYSTLSLRFARGDLPLWESSDMQQFSAFLLTPFIALYTNIAGGTTGLILFSRIFYFVVAFLISVIFLRSFQKLVGEKLALFSAIIIWTYAPFNIYTLGYNNMVNIFLVLSVSLAWCAVSERDGKKKILFLIATAITQVLMCVFHPAGVFACLFIIALMTILLIRQNKGKKGLAKMLITYFVSGFLTVLLIALLIVGRTGIELAVKGLHNMLNNPFYGEETKNYFILLRDAAQYIWNNIPLNILYVLVLAFVLITRYKWRHKFKMVYLIMVLVLFVLGIANAFVVRDPSVRGIYLFLNIAIMMPIICFMLSKKEKKITCNLVLFFYVPSWMLFLGVLCFSAGGYYQAPQALLLAGISVLILFGVWVKEAFKAKRILRSVFQYSVMTIICCCMTINSLCFPYRDVAINLATTHIERGIYAGLYTNEQKAEKLVQFETDIKALGGQGTIQFLECFPAGYSMSDMKADSHDLFMSTYYLYGMDWSNSILRYYNEVAGMPNYIVYAHEYFTPVFRENIDIKDINDPYYVLHSMIRNYYTPVMEKDEYSIYRKKDGIDFVKFVMDDGTYVKSAFELELLNGIGIDYTPPDVETVQNTELNPLLEPGKRGVWLYANANKGDYKVKIRGENLKNVLPVVIYTGEDNIDKAAVLDDMNVNEKEINFIFRLDRYGKNIRLVTLNESEENSKISNIKVEVIQ